MAGKDIQIIFPVSLTLTAVFLVLVYAPLPSTITDEEKVQAQIHRMVKQNVNPLSGVASWYDYEKKEWKK